MSSNTGRPPPLPPRASASNLAAPPLPPRQGSQTAPAIVNEDIVIVDADGNAIPTILSPPVVVESATPEAEIQTTTKAADAKSVISLKTIHPASAPSISDGKAKEWLSPGRWMQLVADLGKEETDDVKALRKQVEQEEIKRYMTNFNKHVDYLRLNPPRPKPTPTTRTHPIPSDFARKKPISSQLNDADGDLTEAEKKDKEEREDIARRERQAEVDAAAAAGTGEVVEDKEAGEDVDQEQVRGVKPVDDKEIDWFAYYLAKLTYHLNVPHPIPIHPTPTLSSSTPEFTIARFKSASTRLYSTAKAGPWERIGVGLGGVVMWDDIGLTLKWMGTYLILMFTSTFLPFLIGSLLYTLLKPRFSPESAAQLQERLLAGVKKQEEIDRAKQEKADKKKNKANAKKNKGILNVLANDSDSDSSSSESDSDMDLLDKTKDVSDKINQATLHAAQKLKKKTKTQIKASAGKTSTGSKVKLFSAWETFQREHGAQIQLVLNDLADMHEKIINLFAWKRPQASVKAAIGMIVAMFATYFTPTWVFVKVIELAIFAVMFFVIPIVARLPVYDPMAWMMGDAPTDAEHALDLIHKYGLEGKVWKEAEKPKTPKTPKTPTHARADSLAVTEETDSIISEVKQESSGRWTDVNEQDLGNLSKGHKWLETGRQYMQGERSLDLSFLRNDKDWDAVPTDVVAAKRLSLGGIGGGIVLRTKSRDTAYTTDSITYLAHHNGNSGTLFISSTGLRFAPFISGKKKDKTKDKEDPTAQVLEIEASDIPAPGPIETAGDTKGGVIVDGKEVRIPMSEVSGLGKIQKSTLGVTISSGLEIETLSAGAFNKLLASSHSGIKRG